MLKNIFKKEKENKEKINNNNILVAALLIHAARIDDNYTATEKEIIKKALIDLKLVERNNSAKLLDEAEIKEQDSNQIVGFTREIKKNSMKFRLKIVEILWKIIYSDNISDNYESNLIRRICGLLYISDKDSGDIKLKVKNSMEFRLKIVEILWKIIYSDGTSNNYESNLIRRVCGLLYVSDKDSGMIKLKMKDSVK